MNKKRGIFKPILIVIVTTASLVTYGQRNQHQHRHQHQRGGSSAAAVTIVCSFSDYASIAAEIAGSYGSIQFIAHGEQDPHFVPPKPSYAMLLRDADMWITTGMDLEIWSSSLLDKARNKKIMDGAIGFVSVSDGVPVLQKVDKVDRTEGDVHLMGNPHINTGPLNWKIMATNIATGLIKVDPSHASYYQSNLKDFNDRVDRALFGDELVELLGGETLTRLMENKTLFTFLEKDYQGEPLIDKLGGWLKQMEPYRGMKIVAYHKNWIYFIETFGLEIIGYIEPKPGIPPSAKHVQHMIQTIKDQGIKMMLVASYFEKNSARMIEEKTGVSAVYLPLFVKGVPGIEDNFQLVDYWIEQVHTHMN